MFTVTVYQAGHCTAPEKLIMRDGRWQSTTLPALFFLLEHAEHGRILVDTGYAPRIYEYEGLSSFPYSTFARMHSFFVEDGETAVSQIDPSSIDAIILTHLHPNQIGGLRDFPDVALIYFQEAYAVAEENRTRQAMLSRFMPDLLPDDFLTRSRTRSATRSRPIPYQFMPFTHGWDIFEDGSLLAVHLPGHAYGQMGLFVQTAEGLVFLCADACWHSRNYREPVRPHPTANLLKNEAKVYRNILERIQEFHRRNPTVPIYPSHCPEVARLVKR